VGTLTALTYILTIDDPTRFAHSRDVGCYLGMRPGRRESGNMKRELGITKEGNVYLRQLLVQCGHVMLASRGRDSDLRRWGLKLAGRKVKNAKKRACVAVARKLSVLLHYLWVNGVIYEPLYHSSKQEEKVAA
jgi:transposase